MGERRAQLSALPGGSGSRSARPARTRGAAGRTSGSSTRRTTAGTTSSSATSSGGTTPSGSTSTSGSAAPTGRSPSTTACASFLPHLLALSASSPLVEGVNSGLHSARTEIFTRMFPRCGVPDAYGTWAEFEEYVRTLYETGSIDEHTQIWWSVRPHLAYPTVEIRICDAQPDLGESQALAALLLRARRADRPRGRRGRAAAAAAAADDRGEPLARDPLRPLRDAARPRRRTRCAPARAELERLAEWIGAGRRRARRPARPFPATNAAERQIARVEEGWSLRRSTRSRSAQARWSVADEASQGERSRSRPRRSCSSSSRRSSRS